MNWARLSTYTLKPPATQTLLTPHSPKATQQPRDETSVRLRQSPHWPQETPALGMLLVTAPSSRLVPALCIFPSSCSFLTQSWVSPLPAAREPPALNSALPLETRVLKHQHFNPENHRPKSNQPTNEAKKKLSSQRQNQLNFYYISFTNNAKIQRQKPSHKKKIEKNVHLVELLFHIMSQIANT